jgi:hypothetical protein
MWRLRHVFKSKRLLQGEYMSLITESELFMLKETTNAQEWNSACDKIKRARNGQYPEDWYERVMLPGVIREAAERFKKQK